MPEHDTGPTHTPGIELGDLGRRLSELSYQVAKTALLDELGGHELVFTDSAQPLVDVIGHVQVERFESPSDVHTAIYTGVGVDAIGRRAYTDRGPARPPSTTTTSRSSRRPPAGRSGGPPAR